MCKYYNDELQLQRVISAAKARQRLELSPRVSDPIVRTSECRDVSQFV
jgi:hypothetical protein